MYNFSLQKNSTYSKREVFFSFLCHRVYENISFEVIDLRISPVSFVAGFFSTFMDGQQLYVTRHYVLPVHFSFEKQEIFSKCLTFSPKRPSFELLELLFVKIIVIFVKICLTYSKYAIFFSALCPCTIRRMYSQNADKGPCTQYVRKFLAFLDPPSPLYLM